MPASMAGRWEFGEHAWCEACAAYGVELLNEAAKAGLLDLANHPGWGFSEEYTEVPARLAYTARQTTLYWFMIKDGVASGGAGPEIPEACLALPGFHIAAPWALIAGPSGGIYGPVGSALRDYHARILEKQLKAAGKASPPKGSAESVYATKPAPSPPEKVFPLEVARALVDRPALPRPGLHNFAAYTGGRRSPELAGLPETSSFCVDLARCTAAQREQFFKALQR